MKTITMVMAVLLSAGLTGLAGLAGAQNMIAIPPFQSTYSASMTRGFYLQAPVDFVVVGLRVPDESKNGKQNVCLYKHTSAPPAYSGTVPLTPLFSKFGEPSSAIIPCSVSYRTGDWFIVIGACGDAAQLYNSYAARGAFQSRVLGAPTTMYRCGIQSNLTTMQPPHPVWSENAGSPSRVEVYVSSGASIIGVGTGGIGTTQTLYLLSAQEPGFPYQLGSSLGSGPIPIGNRQLGLTVDDMLVVSVGGFLPMIFDGYAGVLDYSGKGTARLNIPNVAALKGIKIHSAFVTLQASAPSGVSTISSTYSFDIQ
jgi:hypothetical protein